MGNVYEWTSSLYQPYPYNAADGRETPSADVTSGRVVRGGSWLDVPLNARTCYRNDNNPTNRNDNIGFRVWCSSHIFRPSLTAQAQLRPVASALTGRSGMGCASGIGRRSRFAARGKELKMARVSPARTARLRWHRCRAHIKARHLLSAL
jgi:hypothetical protein